jgi:hypothetical protein
MKKAFGVTSKMYKANDIYLICVFCVRQDNLDVEKIYFHVVHPMSSVLRSE